MLINHQKYKVIMEQSSPNIGLAKSDILTETMRQYGNIKLQTNRYKFTEEVSDLLCEFVKLHQYEKSKEYLLIRLFNYDSKHLQK